MIDEWDNETPDGRERGKFKTSCTFLLCASVVFFLVTNGVEHKKMRREKVDKKNAYSYNSIDSGCAFKGNKRVRCAREQPVVENVGAANNRKREKKKPNKKPKEVIFVTNPDRQPSEITLKPAKKPSKKEMTIYGSNPARQPTNVKPPKKPDMVIIYGRQPSTKPGSKPSGKKPSSRSRKPYSRSNTIPGRLSNRSATRKKTSKKDKKKDKKEKKRNSAPKRQRVHVPNDATR